MKTPSFLLESVSFLSMASRPFLMRSKFFTAVREPPSPRISNIAASILAISSRIFRS